MKAFFGKKIAVGFLVGMSIVSTTSAFAGRRETVRAADALAKQSARLANRASHTCYCPNTVAFMSRIAELANDISFEARFGTRHELVDPFKRIVKNTLTLKREFLPNVPDVALRIDIKRTLGIYVNEIGFEIYGQTWIPVRTNRYEVASAPASQTLSPEQEADQAITRAASTIESASVASDFSEPAEDRDGTLPSEPGAGSDDEWEGPAPAPLVPGNDWD